METRPAESSKIIKILGNALFGIIVFILAIMAFSVIQNRVSGGPPKVAGHYMFIVLSGSMNPTFDTGSLVFVKPAQPDEIKERDIIAFRGLGDSEALTTHRVVGIDRSGPDGPEFTTRGDANDVDDPNPVPAGNLVGKVALAVPYMGYLLAFGRTKRGLLALIIVPGALLIISEIYKLYINILKSSKQQSTEKK